MIKKILDYIIDNRWAQYLIIILLGLAIGLLEAWLIGFVWKLS